MVVACYPKVPRQKCSRAEHPRITGLDLAQIHRLARRRLAHPGMGRGLAIAFPIHAITTSFPSLKFQLRWFC